uniref:Uncharacterized protein n=1 Tax=Oryza sativa subsp. japonica TaxID=39947 RepID=Q656J3_ORYSJ|nr:hypothetical protein [Oryza sativa Japonica Group]
MNLLVPHRSGGGGELFGSKLELSWGYVGPALQWHVSPWSFPASHGVRVSGLAGRHVGSVWGPVITKGPGPQH